MKKDKKEKKELTTQADQPEVAEKKPVRIIKTIVNVIVNVLIVLILLVSLLIAVMAITSKANNGLPSIFGYTIQTIQSPSMEGGNAMYEGGDLYEGDLIIGKSTEFIFNTPYEVGDIVTYMAVPEGGSSQDPKVPICHRIIDVYENGGERAYRTMGDNNGKADQEEGDYASYINASDIGSVYYNKEYHGFKIAGLGKALDFIQTRMGFFLCILLPMIIFFLVALIRVIINLTIYNKNKAKEDKEEAEKEKEEAVKEAVAAALAEKEKENADMKPEDMTPEQMEQFKKFLEQQKAQESAPAEEAPAEEE